MDATAHISADIEPDVKKEAEGILSTLGISESSAINMFYKQIVLQRGLPFDVKIPTKRMVQIDQLSDEQINSELEKGYQDVLNGRTKPAGEVFANIRRDYGI